MVKFNKAQFQPQTEWNYSDGGTFAANAKGKFAKFSKKNLAKTDGTRVTILLSKDKGDFSEAETLMCTKPLSEKIRSSHAKGTPHKEIFAALSKLSIIVDNDDEEKYFLSLPQGDGEMLLAFEINKMVKEPITMEDVNW
jgi:hypothetical protein